MAKYTLFICKDSQDLIAYHLKYDQEDLLIPDIYCNNIPTLLTVQMYSSHPDTHKGARKTCKENECTHLVVTCIVRVFRGAQKRFLVPVIEGRHLSAKVHFSWYGANHIFCLSHPYVSSGFFCTALPKDHLTQNNTVWHPCVSLNKFEFFMVDILLLLLLLSHGDSHSSYHLLSSSFMHYCMPRNELKNFRAAFTRKEQTNNNNRHKTSGDLGNSIALYQ